MKLKTKFFWFAIMIAILASLCILITACDNDPETKETNSKAKSFFPIDDFEKGPVYSLHWLDYWTTIGYPFADYNWPELSIENLASQILALPSGSYFSVVFEELLGDWDHGEWPERIFSDGGFKNFKDEYLTFGRRGHDQTPIYIDLEYQEKVEDDGTGVAYFAINPIQNLIRNNPVQPWQNFYEFGYDKYKLQRGQSNNPKIAENSCGVSGCESDIGFGCTIQLQSWLPKGWTIGISTLGTAIANATNLRLSVVPSDNGYDLDDGIKYVAVAEHNLLGTEISKADEVLKKYENVVLTTQNQKLAVQEEINSALTALNNAVTRFNRFVLVAGDVDKDRLEAAITMAEIRFRDVHSTDDGSALDTWDLFASTTAYGTFQTALGNAKNVMGDEDVTQPVVDSALTAFNTAVNTFNNALRMVGESGDYKLNEFIPVDFWSATEGWGPNAYCVFAWNNTTYIPHRNQANKMMAMPEDSFLRVIFDGLDDEWPDNIVDNFLVFSVYNRSKTINIPLVGLGVIEDGKGSAFLSNDLFVNFINTNEEEDPGYTWDSWSFYLFQYTADYINPGANGNPWMIEYDGNLRLEAWIPVQ